MAKAHPGCKISTENIQRTAAKLRELESNIEAIETRILERHAFSLHEIRKLNRTIKHEAERMCNQESPGDPALARPQLVKIWKSSEFMSTQFDVIELLANEALFILPCNTGGELYRIVDKCVRIYRPSTNPSRLVIKAPPEFHAKVAVCDKTFHIIPTVLIENALKYSLPESEIMIRLSRKDLDLVMTVRNVFASREGLTDQVFDKGYRASSDQEGSGNGLYLARMVAKQHGATLRVSSKPMESGIHMCEFMLVISEFRAG